MLCIVIVAMRRNHNDVVMSPCITNANLKPLYFWTGEGLCPSPGLGGRFRGSCRQKRPLKRPWRPKRHDAT